MAARKDQKSMFNVEYRRKIIEELMVRRYTSFEISEILEKKGIVNPITGKRFDKATISRDRVAIKERWRKEFKKPIEDLIDECVASLQRVEKEAWKQNNLRLVRDIVKDYRDMFGTDAPKQLNVDLGPEKLNEIISALPTDFRESVREELATTLLKDND